MADALRLDSLPELRSPVAVVAFAGWNDAASAATNAARFLARRLGARRFASIDPEPFTDFRSTRPTVRLNAFGEREIVWPQTDFLYARNPTGPHDVVVGIGVEPDLRWRTYSGIVVELLRRLGVTLFVSLGALLADVPHTRPVRVTGTAPDPETAARLGLTVSRYEGPTGIVGVLTDAVRRAGIPAMSLWANVPHYITTAQNPPATVALLQRLQEPLGLTFDLTELEKAGDRFVRDVNAAIAANPEIQAYVRQLEADADQAATEEPSLPPAKELLLDIEEFLRRQRGERDG
ncbi:hypothetical protein HRbin29_01447 [bacterium HR29]|nr:hypothetical protein HRbin29_01447 [bacterium HR29]